MSVYRKSFIWCDDCNEHQHDFFGEWSLADMRASEHARGWRTIAKNIEGELVTLDICPECWAKREGSK